MEPKSPPAPSLSRAGLEESEYSSPSMLMYTRSYVKKVIAHAGTVRICAVPYKNDAFQLSSTKQTALCTQLHWYWRSGYLRAAADPKFIIVTKDKPRKARKTAPCDWAGLKE